jgi:hypothetical protein
MYTKQILWRLLSSVADPDPDLEDPLVIGLLDPEPDPYYFIKEILEGKNNKPFYFLRFISFCVTILI